MSKIRIIIIGVVALFVVVFLPYQAFKWTAMRVYVGPDEALVVINKFGPALPPGRITVEPGQDYKGVQQEVRGPGRYFLNPVTHDWKTVKVIEIAAGNPQRWDWEPDGRLKDPDAAPMVGLVTLKEGKAPPPGQEIVDEGYKGIQREVLTPGTYKINPERYSVTLFPAVVVPPGSVGVVTRLVEDVIQTNSAPLAETSATVASTQPTRLVAGATERGILQDVLQPGIYYLNPRMAKVTVVPVGYDPITLEAPKDVRPRPGVEQNKGSIRFLSSDGYQIEADFTVVWGRTPADAPHIVANIGNVDKVRTNVIEQAMRAACQNEGAKLTAKELIQGETRSKFQDAMQASLSEQVSSRHIHILLALIRNISVKDNTGKDQTEGLLATIQRANIEKEKELTNRQKTATAMVKANHEQALKLVEVAKETVASETNVLVANILAEGQKKAAETDARRELEVASINLEMARLDADRTEILGKASAQVEQLKNEAEAKGAKMLIDAFGSPGAYNKYIFAKNFDPKELRLIFAGPGTFWTDLKSFQEIGASQTMQGGQLKK